MNLNAIELKFKYTTTKNSMYTTQLKKILDLNYYWPSRIMLLHFSCVARVMSGNWREWWYPAFCRYLLDVRVVVMQYECKGWKIKKSLFGWAAGEWLLCRWRENEGCFIGGGPTTELSSWRSRMENGVRVLKSPHPAHLVCAWWKESLEGLRLAWEGFCVWGVAVENGVCCEEGYCMYVVE